MTFSTLENAYLNFWRYCMPPFLIMALIGLWFLCVPMNLHAAYIGILLCVPMVATQILGIVFACSIWWHDILRKL